MSVGRVRRSASRHVIRESSFEGIQKSTKKQHESEKDEKESGSSNSSSPVGPTKKPNMPRITTLFDNDASPHRRASVNSGFDQSGGASARS